MDRLSWDDYFMAFAHLAATRSTCLRRKVGAVIVRNRHILATGYNGPPKSVAHCESCIRDEKNIPSGEQNDISRASHAEANAIAQAAYQGTRIQGATLYCTNQPCGMCAKSVINAGIVSVLYTHPYNDQLADFLFEQANVRLKQIPCPMITLPADLIGTTFGFS